MSQPPDPQSIAVLLAPPSTAAKRLFQSYAAALERGISGLSVRPETPDDVAFIHALYASTRAEELKPVGWPAGVQRDFLLRQSTAQLWHYRRHYPDAAFLLGLRGRRPIGRIYLNVTPGDLRIMDIALMPENRGRGLGRALMSAMAALARELDAGLSLHVEPNNPARAWYRRLGFEEVETVGAYLFMRLPADGLPAAQEKLIS